MALSIFETLSIYYKIVIRIYQTVSINLVFTKRRARVILVKVNSDVLEPLFQIYGLSKHGPKMNVNGRKLI